MKRILVDRSIFHGNKFKEIKLSGLLNYVRSGAIQIYYTSDFLEETLRNIQYDGMFSELWNYLCDLNNTHWFKSPAEIIRAEYSQNTNGYYYLKSQDDILAIRNTVDKFIQGQIPLDCFDTAIIETNTERKNKIILRNKILNLRKTKKYSIKDFDKFLEINSENHFRDMLLPSLELNYDKNIAWRTNPKKYPFINYYIQSKLLTLFLPLADHNLAVDINDKTDAGQLAYLLWCDVLVTDDNKFMAKAFEILNQEHKKERWTQYNLITRLA